MAGKICSICGKPSGIYPLCKDCFNLRDEGKIIQCPDCKSWYYKNKYCTVCNTNMLNEEEEIEVERQPQEDKKCIICGEYAPNGPLCRDCYYEMLEIKDSFDKNQKVFQLRDYYFNLKSNIYRIKNFEYVQSNCLKLMALAVLSKEIYDELSLTNRVVNDIKEIIEKKSTQEQQEISDTKKIKNNDIEDEHKEEIKRTDDGHYVKSDAEAIIDNILYGELRIVHCYNKKVPIDSEEQTITCDWFIPVVSSRKGIYIEYWGMNTKKYLANKERKLKQYKEHNIPLINIEKDEYKDIQGLTDRLISEINTLAKKYFKITDFIDP